MSREETHYLLTGDYTERLNELFAAAQAAREDEQASAGRLGDSDPFVELSREHAALKAEAEERGIKVTVRTITRGDWRKLKVNHPPRTEGDPDSLKADRVAGINLESCEDDLVFMSLAWPEFKTRAAFDEWADDLPEADWRLLLGWCWEKSVESKFDPKSLPASPTRTSN